MDIKQLKAEKKAKEGQEALELYRKYGNLRAVGRIMGKSHEWVRKTLSELSPTDPIDKF